MTLPFIIAEIGNNHEGNIAFAERMIDQAIVCGADMVKFQAGTAEGFARNPNDPAEIAKYRRLALSRKSYRDLIKYCDRKCVEVFFSTWGDGFEELQPPKMKYFKVAARQCNKEYIAKFDTENTFVSIPHTMNEEQILELGIKKAIPFHVVSCYPASDPFLERIELLRNLFPNRDIGYSDHCVGVGACIEAALKYNVEYIEKHFTISHDFGPHRDHLHSADIEEFCHLTTTINGGGT